MKKKRVLNYTVNIYPAEEGGFWAKVPILPGCHTQGKTMEEIVERIQEAIRGYIKSLLKHKSPIPLEEKTLKVSRISIPVRLPAKA